jgi:hypothetical protein
VEPIRTALIAVWLTIDDRRRRALADDRGMSTEAAIITGLFAALAVAVAGVITVRAMGWANSTPQSGG